MKERILEIVRAITRNGYFKGSKYELTINYEKIVVSYKKEYKIDFDEYMYIESVLPSEPITSFNFTITVEGGIVDQDYGDKPYDSNWKSTAFVFYGSDMKTNKNEASISFRYLGDNGIDNFDWKMSSVDDEGNPYTNTTYKIEDLDNVIEFLIKLDQEICANSHRINTLFENNKKYFTKTKEEKDE